MIGDDARRFVIISDPAKRSFSQVPSVRDAQMNPFRRHDDRFPCSNDLEISDFWKTLQPHYRMAVKIGATWVQSRPQFLEIRNLNSDLYTSWMEWLRFVLSGRV
ncbi:MAG: hypothetical protein ACREDY_08460 [Bradyrhizobium sp.]